MKSPSNIAQILSTNPKLSVSTLSFVENVKPYITNDNLPFFPEYTQHNIQHNIEILQTCEELITEASLEAVTASDIAALVIAIYLHDIAMHISEDGFVSLIDTDQTKWNPISEFYDKPWHSLWFDYLSEAKRWDDRKLISVFGDTEPIRIPPKKPIDFTLRDRLLIGEFIRRHHGRLAHHISFSGIPAKNGESVLILESFDKDFKDISGLIARSHTLSIRSCSSYLEEKFHKREFVGIHAIYLMVLLRISDYLQIQPTRAPKEVIKIRQFNSPISTGEWKVHASVRNITYASEDPEAIFIEAHPQDVHTFLKVKRWLEGIQNELDISWAVLGETYGRFEKEGLNHLGISLRRIRSNIDNVNQFAKSVSYIPEKVSFQAANPDLLKLLIAPLYGDKVEIGIRELLQNAIDAVRERDEYIKHSKVSKPDSKYKNDVIISVNMDEDNNIAKSITVQDFGIGMKLETVKEYFLKAGSTFRKSHIWKKEFEKEDGDSKVLRSGRFGVGVLAAFLIGDEIEVKTRFYNDNPSNGIKLIARLESDAIEILQIEKTIPGTEIKINLNSKTKQTVKKWTENESYTNSDWDWFGLDYPKVSRVILPKNTQIEQEYNLPNPNTKLPKDWIQLNVKNFDSILWTFSYRNPSLTCNGIFIDRYGYSRDEELIKDNFHKIIIPNLSVFDPNGKLPINLQRNALIGKLPFFDNLKNDVITCFLANILKQSPSFKDIKLETSIDSLIPIINKGLLKNPENSRSRTNWIEHDLFFMINDGIALVEPYFIAKNLDSLVISNRELFKTNPDFFEESLIDNGILFFSLNKNNAGVKKIVDVLRFGTRAFGNYFSEDYIDSKYGFAQTVEVENAILIVNTNFFHEYCKKEIKISKRFISELKILAEKNGYTVLSNGKNALTPSIQKIINDSKLKIESKDFYIEWIIQKDIEYAPSIIGKEWLDIFDLPYIPFGIKERKEKLVSAYEKLKPYWDYEP